MRAGFSPIENPHSHHQNFIKNFYFFLLMLLLIEAGFVNLIPDPTDFDLHLKRQMLNMARKRTANLHISPEGEPRIKLLMEEDMHRDMMLMPSEYLAQQLRESSLDINEKGVAEALEYIRLQQERDPLAALQENIFGGPEQGGQLSMSKMGPNFEMAPYIAQATGASIITDSPFRWKENQMAVSRQGSGAPYQLPRFAKALKGEAFDFPNSIEDFAAMDETRAFQSYAPLFADIFNYLIKREKQSAKPNWESQPTRQHNRAWRMKPAGTWDDRFRLCIDDVSQHQDGRCQLGSSASRTERCPAAAAKTSDWACESINKRPSRRATPQVAQYQSYVVTARTFTNASRPINLRTDALSSAAKMRPRQNQLAESFPPHRQMWQARLRLIAG